MRGYNTELREVINALRYVVRSECSWRMLPKEGAVLVKTNVLLVLPNKLAELGAVYDCLH